MRDKKKGSPGIFSMRDAENSSPHGSMLEKLGSERIVYGDWIVNNAREMPQPYTFSIACVCETLNVVGRDGNEKSTDSLSAWTGRYRLASGKGAIVRPGDHALYEKTLLGNNGPAVTGTSAFISHLVDAVVVSAPCSVVHIYTNVLTLHCLPGYAHV
jgi:hypothetical protein